MSKTLPAANGTCHFEWTIHNFSCWYHELHDALYSEKFLNEYYLKVELYPETRKGHLAVTCLGPYIDSDLTFHGPDGSLIFKQKLISRNESDLPDVGKLLHGPNFKEVLARIKQSEAHYGDRLTLRFSISTGLKDSIPNSVVLHSEIEVIETTLKLSLPQFFSSKSSSSSHVTSPSSSYATSPCSPNLSNVTSPSSSHTNSPSSSHTNSPSSLNLSNVTTSSSSPDTSPSSSPNLSNVTSTSSSQDTSPSSIHVTSLLYPSCGDNIEELHLSLHKKRIGCFIEFKLKPSDHPFIVRVHTTVLDEEDSAIRSEENEKLFWDMEEWSFMKPFCCEVKHQELSVLFRFKIIPCLQMQQRSYGHCSTMDPGIVTEIPSNSVSENAVADLAKDFKRLLVDKEFADFKLKCGDISFPVHRNVLSFRSPVFKALLSSGLKEATSDSVDIEDLNPSTLGLFVTYLYTGAVEGLEWDSAVKLYYAADKYQVLCLKKECANFLCDNASVSNVADVLLLDFVHCDCQLKSAAYEILLKANLNEEVPKLPYITQLYTLLLLLASSLPTIHRLHKEKRSKAERARKTFVATTETQSQLGLWLETMRRLARFLTDWVESIALE